MKKCRVGRVVPRTPATKFKVENGFPPSDKGVRWLRPVRMAHNHYSVQSYGSMGSWGEIANCLTRSAARAMCRENNLAYQEWYQRRARIAREIEARRKSEAAFHVPDIR
jgi:hypothetical protein